jgi:DNA-binding MarR family transcriptional regulator
MYTTDWLRIQPLGAYTPGVAPAARWLTDAEQRTWRAFLEATQRLNLQLDRELWQQAGMPLAYYQILAMLSEAPGRTLRMSELAERTWSSRSRLSHAVDRLEASGWVQRLRCPTDKRGSFATLTDAGYAVLATAAPAHVESVRRHLFAQLTPRQVEVLGDICQAVASGLATAAEGCAAADPPEG